MSAGARTAGPGQASRYCPMCNRQTAIETTCYPPMIAVSCQECGHVHRISDEPLQFPIWQYQKDPA